ncbi:polyketide synthase [Colletotrichum tofieldiae]|nr:polyketide synthase [Colletotrichum tofieldiae]
MYVGQALSELRITGLATFSSKGSVHGGATATADGLMALSMKNVRFAILHGSSLDQDADTVAAALLQWKPDVELVSPSELIRPRKCLRPVLAKLERLTLLSMVKTLQLVEGTKITGHLYRFRYWLSSQRARAAKGEYHHVSDAKTLVSLFEPQLSREIETAMEDVRKVGGLEVAELIPRVMSSAPSIFNGEVSPIEVLIADGGLGNIYRFIQSLCDSTPLFECLSHADPKMKVLEIGAGTGGTTAEVLRGFTSDVGERMYAQYDFTDVSAGFFAAAQERKDPIAQGFEPESYDFIIASNGFLPGWWLGVSDERSAARWDSELRAAGFSGTDAVVYDDETPYQSNANIMSSTVVPILPPGDVCILAGDCHGPAGFLQDILVERGYRVVLSSLDELPEPGVDVISPLDLELPYFHDISEERG